MKSRGYLAWALLVLPLWLAFAWCAAAEPVMGDGWGHHLWYRDHVLSLHELVEMTKSIYIYENPRLGQVAVLLSYAPGPWHALVTPIVELGALALATALALGRWPSVRRADDALAALVVTAIFLACVPQLGPMLFYRPYTGNYLFGLALNLLWLLPYRFASDARRRWLIVPMLALGGAAGMCNEHTGVAFLALGALATLAAWREGRVRAWMLAGLLALAAGYVALLLAPGQHIRYNGLADQAGIVGRIFERGFVGDVLVVARLALALLPALPLIVAGTVAGAPIAPRERWALGALVAGGVICALTLLASPKIGPRLYTASVTLVDAGLAGWLVLRLAGRPRLRIAIAAVAAVTALAITVRLVTIAAAVGPLGDERLVRLAAGAPNTQVEVRRYPIPASRYFLGEDLATDKGAAVATAYGLSGIVLVPSK